MIPDDGKDSFHATGPLALTSRDANVDAPCRHLGVLLGVPIATEKKTTIFTGTDVQIVGGAAAGGSGDMDNIILGTSLACAAGVAAAFWADLRALRARERAMRQGAEFSWGPNGHELRIVLPGLRMPKSPRSSRAGSRWPCLSSRPCFSCSSGSVSRLIVSLLAWCAPAAGGAVLRNAPTHRPRKWSGSSWSRARAGSCARSEHPASLWNSPGRCTVPSMSRHGLVTTLRTKSRLRRWFASTRPINCGIAARCDAAHKKSPLEPRVRTRSSGARCETRPVVAVEPHPALGVAKDQGRSPARGVHREPANPRLLQAGLPERGLHLPGQSHTVQLGRSR